MKRWAALLLMVWVAPEGAETAPPWKFAIFGSAGWSGFGADEGGLGGGPSFGAGVDIRPFRRLGFELEVNRVHYRRYSEGTMSEVIRAHFPELAVGPELLFEGTALFVTANVVYHNDISPRSQLYVLGGAGIVRETSRRTEAFPNVPETTVEEFTFNAAVGVEIFISPRVAIRPEFRTSNFLILSSWDSHLYQHRVSVALAYHR